ncbi:MAG: hypothetical protein H7836_04895 [Magnetococcus sp. YQC-3]
MSLNDRFQIARKQLRLTRKWQADAVIVSQVAIPNPESGRYGFSLPVSSP